MFSAHQTVQEGWQSFKSYPKLKQLYLYNILFILVTAIAQLTPDSPFVKSGAAIVGILGSIASLLCFYLSYMAIAHYVMNGWIFKTAHDFVKPPSSLWRLFWKTVVISFIAILPLFVTGIIIELFLSDGIAKFLLGGLMVLMALFWFIFVVVKLYVGIPHFSVRDQGSLRSLFDITDGYFWYLACVIGWVFIYALVIMILLGLIMILFGLIAFLSGPLGGLITAFVVGVVQITASLLYIFIAAEAYKQIIENKS